MLRCEKRRGKKKQKSKTKNNRDKKYLAAILKTEKKLIVRGQSKARGAKKEK